MARNKAYQRAEQMIQAARQSGAKKLDLSVAWGAKDSQKLSRSSGVQSNRLGEEEVSRHALVRTHMAAASFA